MGDVDQAGAPVGTAPVGGLQQVFEGIADEQLSGNGGRLLGAEALQLIQQPVPVGGQGLHPAAVARILEQHLDQMFHIELAMAPAAGLVLAGEQQFPGGLAESIGLAGEAAEAHRSFAPGIGVEAFRQWHPASCPAGSARSCSRRDPPRRRSRCCRVSSGPAAAPPGRPCRRWRRRWW